HRLRLATPSLVPLILAALCATAAWASGPAPSQRLDHTTVYDTAGARLILFGGLDNFGAFNDVWVLPRSTSVWGLLSTQGTPPTPRWGHSAIYDPLRNRMLVFGGFATLIGHPLNDLWELSLGATPTWKFLITGGPTARYVHTAVYDSLRDRMIVFG